MNKKYLIFGLPILALALVSAITYYAMFSTTFTVTPAIDIDGELELIIPGDSIGGETIVGNEITLTNDAPSVRTITIIDDSDENVVVSYVGELELTKKSTSTWEPVGAPITIGYTIVGDIFEVSGVLEGYTLIYYKDAEENEDDEDRLLTIGEIGATDTNLPHSNDWNWGELANYCGLANGYDNYNQCKGAKLWLVENSDIVGDELNWANMANYYYEMDLIQYNSDGEIVIYPGSSLTITPEYTPSNYLDEEVTITTTIE